MRSRCLVLGAVALAAVTSACGLAGDATGSPPAAPAGVTRGGTLKVGVTAPGCIDPLTAYEPVGKLITKTLCDTAVTLDPVTGQTREALARGWVTTKNGVTVKLRHGVRFTDGAELKSTDLNYSLQQIVLPANGAFAAGLGKEFLAVALAQKSGDVLADPNKAPDVAFAISKYDAQVITRTNNGGALRAFAEPALALISKSAHDGDPQAFARNPVCVGPYVLEKPFGNGDTQIRLRRSERYYGKNVGYTSGGVGYADHIVFTIYPSAADALGAYARGEVDVVQVPRDQVRNVADAASLVYGVANAVEYIGFPTGSSSPFNSIATRTALSQAIDRAKLAADVFGPTAEPATAFEPPALALKTGPSLQGKSTKGAAIPACRNTRIASAEVARATLARGAKDLRGFTLEVNDDGIYPALADALAAQWRAVLGLDVKVEKVPWDAYVAQASGGTGMEKPFRIRWATDAVAPTTTYNDRQTYLATLLSTEATNNGNWGHWDDRAFNFGLTEDAAVLTDVQQRALAFNKLERYLCGAMPVIPLVFDRPAFLVRSGAVGSARKNPVGRDGVLSLRELYVKSQS
jgi:ABC-type transport system substrate-binding protein